MTTMCATSENFRQVREACIRECTSPFPASCRARPGVLSFEMSPRFLFTRRDKRHSENLLETPTRFPRVFSGSTTKSSLYLLVPFGASHHVKRYIRNNNNPVPIIITVEISQLFFLIICEDTIFFALEHYARRCLYKIIYDIYFTTSPKKISRNTTITE
jgi:hypothetical protein